MKEQLLLITFGWFLGVVSDPVIKYVQKITNQSAIKKTVFSELKNLIVRLAATQYIIQKHLGKLTKDDIKWIQAMNRKYHIDYKNTALEGMSKVLELAEDQFEHS